MNPFTTTPSMNRIERDEFDEIHKRYKKEPAAGCDRVCVSQFELPELPALSLNAWIASQAREPAT